MVPGRGEPSDTTKGKSARPAQAGPALLSPGAGSSWARFRQNTRLLQWLPGTGGGTGFSVPAPSLPGGVSTCSFASLLLKGNITQSCTRHRPETKCSSGRGCSPHPTFGCLSSQPPSCVCSVHSYNQGPSRVLGGRDAVGGDRRAGGCMGQRGVVTGLAKPSSDGDRRQQLLNSGGLAGLAPGTGNTVA